MDSYAILYLFYKFTSQTKLPSALEKQKGTSCHQNDPRTKRGPNAGSGPSARTAVQGAAAGRPSGAWLARPSAQNL